MKKNKSIKVDEMNTIQGIELYQDLYEMYSLLFFATQNNKLSCLNYYIDDNEFFAEIKDTWDLEMPDRYKKHCELYDRIIKKQILPTEYDNSSTINADFVDENGNSFEVLTLFN